MIGELPVEIVAVSLKDFLLGFFLALALERKAERRILNYFLPSDDKHSKD